jgi:hypothetical protein
VLQEVEEEAMTALAAEIQMRIATESRLMQQATGAQ